MKKIFPVFIAIAFVGCNESATKTAGGPQVVTMGAGYLKGPVFVPEVAGSIRSVSFVNGKYEIDSVIIVENLNKKALLADLSSQKLNDKSSIAQIPDFIKSFLESVSYDKKFEMANPGEEYQVGWKTDERILPNKQLVYFGEGKNIALLSYNSGGLQKAQRVVILKFEGKKVTDYWFNNDFWSDNNSVALTTKEQLIKYLKVTKTKNGNC